VPRIRKKTLERLWADASQSVLNVQPEGYIRLLENYLCTLMGDYLQAKSRKEAIVTEMIDILNKLREEDPLIPPPTPQLMSDKNLARMLAETGPLSDFENDRKLMRYGGLNLRTRQSGNFKGKDKISKKGRKLLRKVLQSIALPLVKKGCLYGDYYHRKKDEMNMPGNKAMTIVSRHLLRKIFGLYRSGKAFEKERFFTCESRYKKLALAA
jgi:transposase